MAGKTMTGNERGGGAVSAPMAIAVLAVITAIGLGVDGVRAAQGLATADAIAKEAARAAGQSLDITAQRRGTTAIDPAAAVQAAKAHLREAGVDGTVTVVTPRRIRVDVRTTRPTVLLGLIGRRELVSNGTAEAELVAVPPTGGTP
jgi:Flp pilus assembly protein TadG